MDVWVEEFRYGKYPVYTVWVDGVIYDQMQLRHGHSLTWTQQNDMAGYYREVLEEYEYAT